MRLGRTPKHENRISVRRPRLTELSKGVDCGESTPQDFGGIRTRSTTNN